MLPRALLLGLLLIVIALSGRGSCALGTAQQKPSQQAGYTEWTRQLLGLQQSQQEHSQEQHRRALQPQTTLAEQRACIYSAFPSVVQSCAATAGGRARTGPRDELIRLLQRCTGTNRGAQPVVRIYAPLSSIGVRLQALTKTYARLLGISISVPLYRLNQLTTAVEDMMKNIPFFNRTQEAWLNVAQYQIGDAMAEGKYRAITDFVTLDQRLNWFSFLPILREAALLYKSEVVALPYSAYTRHLMYRKDTFAKYNITVPRTWGELLSFGRAWNGTEGMHAVCLHYGNCYGGFPAALWELMATYFQTHGYKNPAFLDPDTMELLLDNEAMAGALEVFKALLAISPPDDSESKLCPFYPYRFAAGQCMTTVFLSFGYKLLSHRSQVATAAVRGKVGYALLPGSESVYNRQTKKLIPCDPVMCPYATRYTKPDGTPYWVNYSPWLGIVMFNFNGMSPADLSFYALSIASYLSSEQMSNQLLLEPVSEFAPTRITQLNPAAWLAAGYNEQDTYEFLRNYADSMYHPNIRPPLTFRGGVDQQNVWLNLSAILTSTTTERWMAEATRAFTQSFQNTFNGNMTAMKMDYWASLNREWPRAQPQPTPPMPAPTSADEDPQQDYSNQVRLPIIIPATVIPVCAMLLILLLGARYHGLLQVGTGTESHPGSGPLTTLLVSDIENSTHYWELLSAQVMDVTLKLHNTCIRRLAAKHKGYESVWEGDSFIIASHSPAAALHFCMDMQQELLSLPWPAEVVQCSAAQEIWCAQGGQGPTVKTDTKVQRPTVMISMTDDTASSTEAILAHLPSVVSHQGGSERGSGESIASCSLARARSRNQSRRGRTKADWDMEAVWQAQWQRCAAHTPGAVLAYRGLRVRLGLHAGVADPASITFNTVMQRYHYTGPVRVISNAIASAGRGGCTLLGTDTAALLSADKTGVLTDLPEHCSVYYWGRHILSGVGEPQQLLLVLPNSLACRLALQESELRVEATKAAGIWACPVPSPAGPAAASTALSYVQFTALSTLMAWNATETGRAIKIILTCIQDTMAACYGTRSEDGLSCLLDPAASKSTRRGSFPDSTVRGRVVCVFSAAAETASAQRHPALTFALAVRDRLLTENWRRKLLSHELAQQVGTLGAASVRSQSGEAPSPRADAGASDSPSTSNNIVSTDNNNPNTHGSPDGSTPTKHNSGEAKTLVPATSGLEAPEHGGYLSGPRSEPLPGPISGVDLKPENTSSQGRLGFAEILASLQNRLVAHTEKKAPKATPGLSGQISKRGSNKGHVVIESACLRGPRFKIVVVDAQGAAYTVATRSSGLVVFSGAPEKRAAKLMCKAKSGQIIVDSNLI